jgi:hypothetical protein
MANKTFLFLVLTMFVGSASAQRQSVKPSGVPVNVYVSPFTSRSRIDDEVLASFRDLFEEAFGTAFSHDGTYKVLNRQVIQQIVAEAQNETGLITSVDELNPKVKANLRLAKADGFIFGEVTDDKDSGEVIVDVRLQSFDSVLWWNKSVSIKRGLIHDRSSRKEAMEKLVRSIDASLKADSGIGLVELDADVTLQPQGAPSMTVHIVITPDAGQMSYTARVANGPTFTKGTLSIDGKTFNFNSVRAGDMYALESSVYRASSGQLTVTLSRTPNPSDDSQESGSVSGVFTLVSTPAFSIVQGTQTLTLTGRVLGTYKKLAGHLNPNSLSQHLWGFRGPGVHEASFVPAV